VSPWPQLPPEEDSRSRLSPDAPRRRFVTLHYSPRVRESATRSAEATSLDEDTAAGCRDVSAFSLLYVITADAHLDLPT
jgi:hypothetical protein